MSYKFAESSRFKLHPLEGVIRVKNVDRIQNKKGEISHYTKGFLKINGRSFPTTFLIAGLGKESIILGLPWLRRINPVINWRIGTFQFRMTDRTHPEFSFGKGRTLIRRVQMEKPNDEHLAWHWKIVKEERKAFKEMTKEEKQAWAQKMVAKARENMALKMKAKEEESTNGHLKRKHRMAKDCRVYPLSLAEQKKLDKFLDKSLENGYIQPLKLPMVLPFFFVAKKDSDALRPC
ncbi:hypothetical protein L208DRAFT_1213619, partial [Tricholoma matsutake]